MITIKSHGFKYSRPEANIIFDVSYFKNPWRKDDIRNEKDRNKQWEKAVTFMRAQEGVEVFVKKVADLLFVYNYQFPDENIQVAICCSAGEFRSPVIVELVSKALEELGVEVNNQ